MSGINPSVLKRPVKVFQREPQLLEFNIFKLHKLPKSSTEKRVLRWEHLIISQTISTQINHEEHRKIHTEINIANVFRRKLKKVQDNFEHLLQKA